MNEAIEKPGDRGAGERGNGRTEKLSETMRRVWAQY